MTEREEKLVDVLTRIKQWCDAYPLDAFPEPDFKAANEILRAHGMTLGAISASNMRYALSGVSKIVDEALSGKETPQRGTDIAQAKEQQK